MKQYTRFYYVKHYDYYLAATIDLIEALNICNDVWIFWTDDHGDKGIQLV